MKHTTLLIFMFLSVNLFAQAPPNDLCGGAIALTLGSGTCTSATQAFINNSATHSGELPLPSCGFYQGFDIWYSVIVPASGEIVIETSSDGTGSITDTDIEAYSGNCGNLTQIECGDNQGLNAFARLKLSSLTLNSTIYIRAWNPYASEFGSFNICAYDPPPPPANDACSGAIGLSPGSGACSSPVQAFINNGGTDSESLPFFPICGTYEGFDIWYSVLVPASGNLIIETSDDGTGTITDTGIDVITGNCNNVIDYIGCDDNSGSGDYSLLFLSSLTPNSTIYIRAWDNEGDDFGSFNICAYDPSPLPPPPVNDVCSGAIALIPGACTPPTQANITFSGTDSGELPTPFCGGYDGFDLWFSVEVPPSGELVIETSDDGTGSILDTAIEAYSGVCGNLIPIECNEYDQSFYAQLVLSNLAPGSTIYIRAWDAGYFVQFFGSFNISASDPSFMPDANYCEDFTNFVGDGVSDCWSEGTGGDASTGPATMTNSRWNRNTSNWGNSTTAPIANVDLLNYSDIDEWLISPEIFLDPAINYNVIFDTHFFQLSFLGGAIAGVFEADDKVEFLITTDGGASWTILQTWDESVTYPNIVTPQVVDITSYSGTVQFAFYATNGVTHEASLLPIFGIDEFCLQEGCIQAIMDADMDGIADSEDLCPNDRDVSLHFENRGEQSGNTSDYVEIPHDADFNLTGGDFAFEAWVHPTSGADTRAILTKGSGFGSTSSFLFDIMSDDGAFWGEPGKLGLFLFSGNNVEGEFSESSIPLDVWTHVAVSVDNSGTNPVVTFYVNGVMDGVRTFTFLSSALNNTDTYPVLIGRQGSTTQTNHFEGQMDEVAVWNRTLSDIDIVKSMVGVYTGAESGLVAYYDFNDADANVDNTANTTLMDKANNHDGTLFNFDLTDCESNWVPGHNQSTCEPCQTNYSNGLISYWNFDNNVEDHRGLNDGTIVGVGSSYAPGVFGSGIDLDGATSYINAGNDPSLDFTNKSLTISAWFRVDAFNRFWQALISKGESDNFRVHRFSNSNHMAYSGGSPDVEAPIDVNDGTFHHIVAVTIANVSKSIYLDGALIATVPIGTNIVDSGLDLLIGNNPAASDRFWNGMIDDVAIWDIPLNDCDVSFLYHAQRSLEEFTDLDACPPALTLSGTQSTTADYESGGSITSTQMINSPAQVDYDATTEIILSPDFEVAGGAVFHAFIDGCGGALLRSEAEPRQ